MISKELEVLLHHAFLEARQKRHPFISLEHLLLAILKPGSGVASTLAAREVDVDAMRSELIGHIDKHTPVAKRRDVDPQTYNEVDTQPTQEFQRVLQRAIEGVQSFERPEVTSADVLIALLAEKQSPAASLLGKYGVHDFDVQHFESQPVASPATPPTEDVGDVGDAHEVQIVLFNDDVTPMEFVVNTLENLFTMERDEATEVMLEVHRQGRAVCGLYARETAETIVRAVISHARKQGYPLRCQMVVPAT